MSRTCDIGLLWHSDCNGNLGVGALTVGNMALVREAAATVGVAPRFHLFKPVEHSPAYVEGFATVHEITARFMGNPAGYWAALAPLDLMLDISAGDSFTDIYSARRFALIIATKAMALARGIPLVFSPQTIGPFSRQPHTVLAAGVMTRAAAVYARDSQSLDAARHIAPGARCFGAIDVAFALPFAPRPKGPGVRVGINVSGLLYSGGYTGRNEFGLELDYRAFTHGLIEALLARGDLAVELITHVNAPQIPRDDDGAAADALKARWPALVRVPAFRSPSEAKSYISGLDFLVGARMHATIAAYSAGVPVVPVSYSRKFEGLYGSLGYKWLVPARGMETSAAIAYTLDAFDRRAELATAIAASAGTIEAGLASYRDGLSRLISGLARG
jgi:polysaccharide pyruvyl transferase WcaK-like protein